MDSRVVDSEGGLAGIPDSTVARRDYPSAPVVGVLAVVQRETRFLLVMRGREPNKGAWGFPGGVQELGETVREAALRELAEETGVAADEPEILTTLDVIDKDETGTVRFHYTLIAVHLLWRCGEGVAADDAEELGWFGLEDLPNLRALPKVGELMLQALERRQNPSRGGEPEQAPTSALAILD